MLALGLVVMRGWPASSEPRGEGRVNHKLAHPCSGQDSGLLPIFGVRRSTGQLQPVPSGRAIAKLFGLHAKLALALPADDRPMRGKVGAVAKPFVLDLMEDWQD